MTFPGLVRANNLNDITDQEKAWDNLGVNIEASFSYSASAGIDLYNSLSLPVRTNPNGVWAYGYATSLGSTSMTLVAIQTATGWNGPGSFNTPFFNASFNSEQINSHPPVAVTSNTVAVVRWTSPFVDNTPIQIEAAFRKNDPSGNGINPRIYKESTLIHNAGIVTSTTVASSFVGSTVVNNGQRIFFQVGDNGNSSNDNFWYDYIRIIVP